MKKKLYSAIAVATLFATLPSCDNFLDKMPDQRTEIDTDTKVGELMVSAYPSNTAMMLYEHRSDNVMDNGKQYGAAYITLAQNYVWEDITNIDQDTPQGLWQSCYKAISAANQTLESIAAIGENSKNLPFKGEALLCRAYAHFVLANTFCQPYSATNAATHLGIPYVEAPEKIIGTKYERGTLQETYDKIARDIEAGYPLIDDNFYNVVKYHFNKKAAAAFAARFYLYLGEYQKCVDYATKAIGTDPSASLRNMSEYTLFNQVKEWSNRYVSKDEPANLMMIPTYSRWGRNYYTQRYSNSEVLSRNCTLWSSGPWGSSSLPTYSRTFGGSGYATKFFPRCGEFFEITNQTAQTGYPHVVEVPFTVDETLITRAEAYTLLGDYTSAARDLSYWYVKNGATAKTSADIIQYYTNRKATETAALAAGTLSPWLTQVKTLAPVNFTITSTDQEMMLHGVLHARRLETLFLGVRWLDIRRYDIEVIHNIDEENPIILPAGDLRRVHQIPESVVSAGMKPNPR